MKKNQCKTWTPSWTLLDTVFPGIFQDTLTYTNTDNSLYIKQDKEQSLDSKIVFPLWKQRISPESTSYWKKWEKL